MKANTEILWLAFSILDKDYEPNITPQKRFYFNKVGKDVGQHVQLNMHWQIKGIFSHDNRIKREIPQARTMKNRFYSLMQCDLWAVVKFWMSW